MSTQKDLGEWVANLNSRLEEIAAGYAAASPSDKRFVMVAVCGVLSIELRRLAGIEQLNLLPLEDLMLRLNDVTTGKNALAPIKRPKGGRPPDSFRDSIVQGRAVAAVEYLMSVGEREGDAIDFVAKHLGRPKPVEWPANLKSRSRTPSIPSRHPRHRRPTSRQMSR